MTETVLDIENLTIAFGPDGPTVVDGLDLTVGAGEIVALVGESGSGKSMTAKAVLGLLPDGATASGSIRLGGDQVVAAPEESLARLRGTRAAMVFQEPQTALNPVRTVGWQIAQALRARGRISRAAARTRAVELLQLVEIPDPGIRVDWYPHQLSGGQKQRVVIALALSGDPDLLIADEPTTALDVTVQAEILDLLRTLRDDRGTAVLLITHNMGVVADIADRVAVLRRGVLVEDRGVHELFAAPREKYTGHLLAAVPRLPVAADGEVSDPGTSDSGAPAEPVLTVTDLDVVYPARGAAARFHALRGVSVAVAAGEVLGLVGESGSGKTTLGRTALGVVTATGGSVVLDGTDLATVTTRELRALRKGVALVHQDPAASLDPRRSIGDSIAEPLVVHRAASGALLRARVADLLDSVRLPRGFATRRPSELSGGQRQRVALARALALAPRLLVADEPTSALDVSVQAEVLALFADLRAEYRFACLFISHDLAVVHEVADRVAVLRNGELVEIGTTATVFGSPRDEYTRALIDAVPTPDPVEQRTRRAGQRSGPVGRVVLPAAG